MTDESPDDELPGSLARSIATLREEVPVRAEWRDRLLARIESDRAQGRTWRVRPAWAIAAGVMLLLGGALIGRVTGGRGTPTGERTLVSNVRFVFVAPGAARVSVVGDFNQWNASAMPMRRLGDGTWIADVAIDPGSYAYAFVVDGRIEVDPSAPRANSEFGENSILMVRGRGI